MTLSRRAIAVALFASSVSMLSGCALQNTAAPSIESVPAQTISGTVHGGSQPIYGAKVYLLAVTPSGYGGPGIAASSSNASVSLLSVLGGNSVTPDSIGYYATTDSTTGAFSLTGAGAYSCTAGYAQGTTLPLTNVTLPGNEQVYLYVLGGRAANIASANNEVAFLAALGPCNAPTAHVDVNEMTTVATAYAFAGFATDATHIGSSGSTLALAGLNNAFANVGNLAVVSTGSAAASSGTVTRPVSAINTIADIMAACVQSLYGSYNCAQLLENTKSSGATGNLAADSASAIINLAHYPYPSSAGMTALYNLVQGTGAPFTPTLTSQPPDFTLGLGFSGGGLSNPYNVAIDASGNAWVDNFGNPGVLSEFSSSGTPLSGSGFTGSLRYPQGLAIDVSGNVWVANPSTSSISKFSSNGVFSSSITGGGLNNPYGIAFDASSNLWVSNSGQNASSSSISKFSSSGSQVLGSPYTGGGLSYPEGIAIDASGNVWVANETGNTLSKFSSIGLAATASGYIGGGLNMPQGIAIDPSGNVWAANYNPTSLSEFSKGGTPASGSPYTGGGLTASNNIAIDAQGSVWASNTTGNGGVSKFSSAGAPLTSSYGYSGGLPAGSTYGIAIDGSGNVWAANTTNGTLLELIGVSTPVVTPVAANLVTPYATNTSTVNRP